MNLTKLTSLLAVLPLAPPLLAEPLISSWYTEGSGSYARIWQNIADETTQRTTGTITSVTTWDATAITGNLVVGDQPSPVYAGIQGISYSADYVYIQGTGLATSVMGPWYDNTAKTSVFPSFPGNQALLYRFPRVVNYGPDYVSPKNATTPGNCGLFANSVPLYNTTDTFSYSNANAGDAGPTESYQGDGVWNRDAFTNEGVTFDSGNAHQAMESFHYHASPTALRHLLNDSVDYDSTVVFTGLPANGGDSPYTENFNGQHSPIIGWVNDGLPMYGPYGFSDPNDANSDVRRMVSGYQKRDGSNGAYDLAANGRNLLPEWVIHQKGLTTTAIGTNETGPGVNDRFTIGHYMEDYAYKGDLGLTIGTDFDLNEYNVRYSVTPEFPDGTWAYFTCIDAAGTPVYPYNLAFNYFGDSSVASGLTAIEEEVAVVFDGAPSKEATNLSTTSSDDGELTLVWDGIEGGTYRVETSSDLETWSEGTAFTADSQTISAVDPTSLANGTAQRFYRLVRTGIADYDDTEFSSAGGGGGLGPPGGGPPR